MTLLCKQLLVHGLPYKPISIHLRDVTIDGTSLQAGDEVAVYDGELLITSAVWQSSGWPLLLVASPLEANGPGFVHGHAIRFKIWQNKTAQEMDVLPEFCLWWNSDQKRLSNPPVFEELSSAYLSIHWENQKIPTSYRLYRNFPNPFNPSTVIAYDLPEETHVQLTIYDIRGRVVKVVQNGLLEAGHYEVLWDARDENDRHIASGVYLYRISANKFTQIHKKVFTKVTKIWREKC